MLRSLSKYINRISSLDMFASSIYTSAETCTVKKRTTKGMEISTITRVSMTRNIPFCVLCAPDNLKSMDLALKASANFIFT